MVFFATFGTTWHELWARWGIAANPTPTSCFYLYQHLGLKLEAEQAEQVENGGAASDVRLRIVAESLAKGQHRALDRPTRAEQPIPRPAKNLAIGFARSRAAAYHTKTRLVEQMVFEEDLRGESGPTRGAGAAPASTPGSSSSVSTIPAPARPTTLNTRFQVAFLRFAAFSGNHRFLVAFWAVVRKLATVGSLSNTHRFSYEFGHTGSD